MTVARTAIILLNWNGWQDTVECVASLLCLEDQDITIVVCDNASQDDSWLRLLTWCESHLPGNFVIWSPGLHWRSCKLTLIQTGANLGFAGGTNVGIRFVLQHTPCSYVWLLNNDTVVQPNALGQQVRCMQTNREVGLLGSTIAYYDHPATVQCFGGYGFNFWTGRVRPLSVSPNLDSPPSAKWVERRIKYVSGASTFVSRAFIEQVGLLNEQYFLYFEEIDWAVRGRSFRLSYCPESIVFHKEGRSIGSNSSAVQRSRSSEVWLTRNRILFLRTYFPWRLPVALLWMMLVLAVRSMRGHFTLAQTVAGGLWNGLRAPALPLPSLAAWPPETLQIATTQTPRDRVVPPKIVSE